MKRFAARTKVPASQSRGEIETTLSKYGADSFGYANQPGRVSLGFRIKGRMVRFQITVPDQATKPQEYRQRWRALLLCIKAKLETVESGIEEFDEAFMAHIVLPSGRTMAEYALPQLRQAYETGKEPPLLTFNG
jgi:hypothetical protein